ncbi:MAG: hypothetical protein OEW75_12750 [Cyclobacteriaceae bacterium]|nr:hypothetical protein [Cyclobacteriaceae bacterium]
MKYFEVSLALLVVVFYFLLGIPAIPAAAMFGLSAFVLEFYYLFFGIAVFNSLSIKSMFRKASYYNVSFGKIVASIGLGVAFSIAINGSLFIILKLPGGLELLTISTTTLIFAIPIVLFKHFFKYKGISLFYKRVLYRLTPVLVISIYLFLKELWNLEGVTV